MSSSASEAELAALYYGCKQAAPICVTLEGMGHPQPAPTPVTTDNITNGYNDAKSIQIEPPTVQLVKVLQRTASIQISLAKRYS